jgi:hypothetical protein
MNELTKIEDFEENFNEDFKVGDLLTIDQHAVWFEMLQGTLPDYMPPDGPVICIKIQEVSNETGFQPVVVLSKKGFGAVNLGWLDKIK